MKSLLAFIQLTRPVNLLIIAATMYVVRFLIISPIISNQNIALELQYPEWKFFLSVLIMVMLAAAGNIINDYFDVKVDRINKPDKVLVGKGVKRRVAMVSHQALNIGACIIGVYLAYDLGIWLLAAIPMFIAGSLWYYSVVFKRQVLIGNFVVALMVALVPLWVGAFEIPSLALAYSELIVDTQAFVVFIWKWVLGYAAFGFMLTAIREAQKDLEDVRGDNRGGFRTLPIVYGLTLTRYYILIAGLVTLSGIIYLGADWFRGTQEKFYYWGILLLLVIIPLLISLSYSTFGNSKSSFSKASLFSKITMGGGLLFAFVIKFFFEN